MQFTQEFNVDTFPFWGPAKAVVDEIRQAQKLDGLQEIVETAFCDSTPSKTAVNDLVWTESDFFILKTLGLRKQDGEEDKEEEDKEDKEEDGKEGKEGKEGEEGKDKEEEDKEGDKEEDGEEREDERLEAESLEEIQEPAYALMMMTNQENFW